MHLVRGKKLSIQPILKECEKMSNTNGIIKRYFLKYYPELFKPNNPKTFFCRDDCRFLVKSLAEKAGFDFFKV